MLSSNLAFFLFQLLSTSLFLLPFGSILLFLLVGLAYVFNLHLYSFLFAYTVKIYPTEIVLTRLDILV